MADIRKRKSIVQSIIFNKDKWNESGAKGWLKSHDFNTGIETKKSWSTLRARQHDPEVCKQDGHGQKEIGRAGSGINFLFCRPKRS